MKKIIVMTIVILFVITNCKKEDTKRYDFFIVGNYSIKIDSVEFQQSTKKIIFDNNKDLFCLYNNYKSNIKFYTLDGSQGKICYNKKLKNLNQISDIDVHSFDSIYVLKKNKKLEFTDTSFLFKKIYDLNNLYSDDFGNEYKLYGSVFFIPLIVKENIVYLSQAPKFVINNDIKRKKYFSSSIGVIVSIEEKPKIKGYFAKFPQMYSSAKFNTFNCNVIIKNDTIISSYNNNDTLYLQIGTKKETRILNSNYFKSVSEYDFTNNSFKKSRNYTVENSIYIYLLYDNYRKKYLRICKHKQNYKNRNGELNTIWQATWSIVVADENFNVEKEVVFPSKYSYLHVYVTKKGVLIRKNYDNKKKNVTQFDVFMF